MRGLSRHGRRAGFQGRPGSTRRADPKAATQRRALFALMAIAVSTSMLSQHALGGNPLREAFLLIGATPPGPPIAVTAEPGDGRVVVRWEPPATDGGAPITGYTVTAYPGERTAATTANVLQATVTGLQNGTEYRLAVRAHNAVGAGPRAFANLVPSGGGYWSVSADSTVFSFGQAPGLGAVGVALNQPIVGIAPTPDGGGYWLAASDGGVFAFGTAAFLGSAGGIPLNQPVVGLGAAAAGGGYWLVAADGGIFSYGESTFFGSMGGQPLNQPMTGMAGTPTGRGYWTVASDGGVFSFGDAGFFGSTGAIVLNQPIVGMAATPSGRGYWMVASDGGVFAFGDAGFFGSASNLDLNQPMVSMTPTPSGRGYWLVARDGGIFAYGDASFLGTVNPAEQNLPVVGMAPSLVSQAVVPLGPPSRPRDVVARDQTERVRIDWDPPADTGGSPVTRYVISDLTSSDPVTKQVSGETTTVHFHKYDQLDPNEFSFRFRVVAFNAQGQSPPATSNQVSVVRIPSEPTGVTARGGVNAARVQWNGPVHTGGDTPDFYWITAYDPDGEIWPPGPERISVAEAEAGAPPGQQSYAYVYEDLEQNYEFTFTVSAENSAGRGPESAETEPVLIVGDTEDCPSGPSAPGHPSGPSGPPGPGCPTPSGPSGFAEEPPDS